MTDQIPADKVRAILDGWERIKEHADWDDIDNLVQDVRALLPAPPPPTLADMTPNDRLACMWMQCDVEGSAGEWVVADPSFKEGFWRVMSEVVGVRSLPTSTITPRPDLPRLEWPGDKKPDPAPAPALPGRWRLADHKDHGRVIVTDPNPNRDGYVYCVFPSDRDSTGFDWHPYDPEALTYLDTDQEADQ